jgi:hypothetical protein
MMVNLGGFLAVAMRYQYKAVEHKRQLAPTVVAVGRSASEGDVMSAAAAMAAAASGGGPHTARVQVRDYCALTPLATGFALKILSCL